MSTDRTSSDGDPAGHAQQQPAGAAPDAASASLAARVGQMADTLPDRERQALATLLLQAMGPLSRRRWQPSDVLDADQAALLAALRDQSAPDDTGHQE